MKILFMGTPEFARKSLEALVEDGTNEIVGVISQPDKPKGRKMELSMPEVKAYALEKGLKVYQPETLRDNAILPLLEELRPELIVVVAYGKILPEYILNFPKYRCINIHASLLPRFRGAAPIQRAVMAGDRVSGVTSMYLEKGLDTGDMILKAEVPVTRDMTAGMLHDELAEVGGRLLIETVERFKKGELSAEKQDESLACYAHILTKAEGEIDWSQSAEEIYNKVRGLNPWPMAYSALGGKRFVIDMVKIADGSGAPGEIISADSGGITVACGSAAVKIENVKFEGKKKMTVEEYLR
ncbi:MAG: methionyl-tRNA formyltransferase, partial [Clostridia bacterium]